jgi:hypothetical protein
MENVYIFYGHLDIYGHLGNFMTIWYILSSFGAFFPVLVSCTMKNLATLPHSPVFLLYRLLSVR